MSRSGKKILHVDRNDYYGGNEAALSLSEAETWARKHSGDGAVTASFGHASIIKTAPSEEPPANKLGPARSYSVALAPQLLYTRSNLLPALVSSKTHGQLEFQAVGSWFIVSTASGGPNLTRVPGGREDIFQDNALDLKAKRSLMKFLRFVTNYEEQLDIWQEERTTPFSTFLETKFGLPSQSHAPIIALALSSRSSNDTTVEYAVPRIARYLTGIGFFGPGFGALLPKWGGLAEVGQVACRSGAVGGGVYVLSKGITEKHPNVGDIELQLSDGEKVTTKWLAGTSEEIPSSISSVDLPALHVTKSISVVSSPLTSLFPRTSEGGPAPAGAVVLFETPTDSEQPIHILAHSSESGECPARQCVLYASVAEQSQSGFVRLEQAIDSLLRSIEEEPRPNLLWQMQYEQRFAPGPTTSDITSLSVLKLKPLSADLALEDAVLRDVQAAWQQITGADLETFMKFDAREGTLEDEESYE